MTEADWNACTDPQAMLVFVREQGVLSDRKARLFAVACCRRIWPHLPAESCHRAVEAAEDYADGRATSEDLKAAAEVALGLACELHNQPVPPRMYHAAYAAAWTGDEDAWAAVDAAYCAAGAGGGDSQERAAQSALLRELIGSPFRAVPVDPAWLTPAIHGLARHIYDERAFDLMAALGAALSDAGCKDEEVLRHCAEAGPHVRGCWVVDLLLGKR